ncbi:MAG TPA: amidohydrolase family protein [Caulobacteraceae bacterium]|jgi:Tol biopolymer transport system component|nr:amidohydrolase family protein [Caulobacteraceae bacterium]
MKRAFAASLAVLLASTATLAIAAEPSGLPLTPGRQVVFDTDEATWMSPDLSPDGDTVVFDILGHLYAMDAGGGRARAITDGLAFDSQPVFSPDGAWIAFVSDRSGAENVWIAHRDGTAARQITRNETLHEYVSPSWSADGRTLFVSLYRSDRNAMELWRLPLDGAAPEELTKGAFSALGAKASPDGRYLYYARSNGVAFEDDPPMPSWSIHRLDLKTLADDTVVSGQGGGMRPELSRDGRLLAYAARREGKTELRLRDLLTGRDESLQGPVQRDDQESVASRDLMPSASFTPDGKVLLTSWDGKLRRIDLATRTATVVPFQAHFDRAVGPSTRLDIAPDTGPVRARIIQQPTQSPDGKTLAFSALGQLWTMPLKPGAKPRALTHGEPAFMPAWSPDGRSLVYVTWTSQTGGEIWRIDAEGRKPPVKLTDIDGYYTDPVFTPDGRDIIVLRSPTRERNLTLQEPPWTGRAYGQIRQADLVGLPANGGASRVIASGAMGGRPQFVANDPGRVEVIFDDGMGSVALDGSGRTIKFQVKGLGYYFQPDPVPVDDMRLSPDGAHVLVQQEQQLWLIDTPPPGATVTLTRPSVGARRLTRVGADFYQWADGGRSIGWAIGSTWERRPLSSIKLDPPGAPVGSERPEAGRDGVETFHADVEIPRDVPHDAVVLRGATAITERGDEVVRDADIVIVDDKIAAVGPRGSVALPNGAVIRDVSGKFITPGFIDTHDHWGCVRRGELELDNWCLHGALAWGVTSGLDPSTLSVDMMAYQDLEDAGLALGPRIYSTGTAVFSYNQLSSYEETLDLLSRYADDYRLGNLKEYRTGNRRVREWVAMGAKAEHLQPTTEGALDMKLDLTQIIDGLAGNEHAMSATPISKDVIELFVQTRTSYTSTLQITQGGPVGMNFFIARDHPRDDPKVATFYPPAARDKLLGRADWYDPKDYSFPQVAAGAAAIQRGGGIVGVGSHGNVPGLGYHWEMQALASGGMTPAEVLHAATIGSAEDIGRKSTLGSLEPGKYADLLILDRNPLDDIRNAESVDQVMKGGRLYDAATLNEVWPVQKPAPKPWFATN